MNDPREPRLFAIEGAKHALVLRISGRDLPEIVHVGPRLGSLAAPAFDCAHPFGLLDAQERLTLLPDPATGFTGHPGVVLVKDGVWHPAAFALESETAGECGGQWAYTDERLGARLRIRIDLDMPSGVVSIEIALTNTGGQALGVIWLAPALQVPARLGELLTIGGTWGDEWREERGAIGRGLRAIEGRTGRTSHHAFPALVFLAPHTNEESGPALACHVAASGNHRSLAERLRDGRVQAQLGELLLPGEITLAAGETYAAPKVFLAASEAGLNGIRTAFQSFVRRCVLPPTVRARPRPVQFNSWEAIYFDHDRKTLSALITAAAQAGAERFVLDDGWFKGRDSDRAGLGDWTPCPRKYPHGLRPLIEEVNAAGMEFGLWVEPEMVNADSDLYRAHPDWILGPADQLLGRNQYVLDLTRTDVFDHLLRALDRLLSGERISYLKWDMNRDLAAAMSGGRPVAARQARAVRALIDALRDRHAGLEIETCASGGARADYGILARTDRVWVSDALDPILRQRMHRTFSLFFPGEVMGAHIGARRNVLTGRAAGIDARAITAFFGHLGIEQNLLSADEAERGAIREFIALHKEARQFLHAGTLIAVDHPDAALCVMAVIAEDRQRALLTVVPTGPLSAPIPSPVRVPGLEADADYSVRLVRGGAFAAARMKQVPPIAREDVLCLNGAFLALHGLNLPVLRADSALLIDIRRT